MPAYLLRGVWPWEIPWNCRKYKCEHTCPYQKLIRLFHHTATRRETSLACPVVWHAPYCCMSRYTPHRLAVEEPRPTLMVPQWMGRPAETVSPWRANRASGGPRSPTLTHSPLPRDQTAGAHTGSLGCMLVAVARHEHCEAPFSPLTTTLSNHWRSVCRTVTAHVHKLLADAV